MSGSRRVVSLVDDLVSNRVKLAYAETLGSGTYNLRVEERELDTHTPAVIQNGLRRVELLAALDSFPKGVRAYVHQVGGGNV